MNRERAARAYDLIAEGFAELAIAIRETEPAAARAAVPEAGSALPVPADPPLKPQVDAGLAICPIHGTKWTVKEAGVGAKGPYDAFWKCEGRDDNGYCKQKPQKIWRDTHPIREAA